MFTLTHLPYRTSWGNKNQRSHRRWEPTSVDQGYDQFFVWIVYFQTDPLYIYIYYILVFFLSPSLSLYIYKYVYIYIINTLLRLLFRGAIPKCKIHFLGPHSNVKLVAERPPGVVFVGKVVQIPSNRTLTCSSPPPKTPWKMYLTFGYAPAKRVG